MDQDIFAMWRCIVAIAHADGKVHDAERQYLQGIFDNMQRVSGLSAEERAILERDLEDGQDPFDMLGQVKTPKCRGQILYFALYLAKIDGVIDPDEQELIDRLHAKITGAELPDLREQARSALQNPVPFKAENGISGFVDDLISWSGL